jgi:hypothetical protein
MPKKLRPEVLLDLLQLLDQSLTIFQTYVAVQAVEQ